MVQASKDCSMVVPPLTFGLFRWRRFWCWTKDGGPFWAIRDEIRFLGLGKEEGGPRREGAWAWANRSVPDLLIFYWARRG